MNKLNILGLLVWRSALVIAGLLVVAVLFFVTWLERGLRLLAPLIFSALPDEYRRILLLLVVPPRKCDSSFKLVNAA
jgi:hypothetical protein